MKRILLSLSISIFAYSVHAQTTWENVYALIQTNCASCHVAGHESGLDLSGDAASVYANLFNVVPTNVASAARGFKRVYPGQPYQSFLFSKINNGLALDVSLGAGEGAACPQGAPALNNKDIELVRQWILYGAQESDTLVDMAAIADFYDNDGLQSIPSPPAPPAPGTGYQIHFGPFFIWPGTEHEYWLKYYTGVPVDQEVNRVDTYMGEYSHHFITYKFYDPAWVTATPSGLHDGPDFAGIDLVTAHQYPDSIKLPQGTAFFWEANTVLNLNSHYINYSSDKVQACEAYVNVFTQPVGTAVQTMHSVLLSNQSFNIPNNGLPYTDEASAFENGHGDDEFYLWAISSHTHKLGADFNIYKRTPEHDKGEQIFDASCSATEGIPGCLDEIYDYKHPPIRYWESMLPIKWSDGIIYQATWINNGPTDVSFGLTSLDEMMVIFYFYVDDTTGLNLPLPIAEIPAAVPSMQVFPNPTHGTIYVYAPAADLSNAVISITDLTGKTIYNNQANATMLANNKIKIETGDIASGIYLVNILQPDGSAYTQKLVVQ